VPAALVTGCGGGSGGNEGDAQALVDKAFAKPVKSADVKLDAQLKVEGLQGFTKPVRLQASGPYLSSKGALPKADIDLKIGAQGQGQSVQTGFLSTGDRAFLKFGGQYYEQPRANVAAANRRLQRDRGKSGNSLGIHPGSWVRDAKMEGSETVGGVDTDHVSARVDVRKVLDDLNALAKKGTGAVGGTTSPQPLTQDKIDQAAQTVKDPTFDVYVGKADGVVHRVSGNLALSVPDSERAQANGITGGSLRFSLDLTNTNGNQTVEVPATSQPISALSKQLGGAAALGALGGASGTPANPGTTSPRSSGGGTATTPDSSAFKRYSQCLDKAKPGDTQALSRCSALLNP
jgi:hypothetical protein